MSQLALDTPRPSRHRVEALASTLAGFVAPGHKTVPRSILAECRIVAEDALLAAETRVAPIRERLETRKPPAAKPAGPPTLVDGP